MKKRIYLSPPHMSGGELEIVKNAFNSNWIAPVGPDIDAFEKEVCDYTGAKYGVALSSGTAAIHLALIISGVQPGDEVLCSTFTFAGSAFPIIYVGATPIFIDSNKESWNMDPNLLEKGIKARIKKGNKPKVCIVVHLYGQSADLDPIIEICSKYEIILIEDAAESMGATYKGEHTGTRAPLGIFSFNGNKIITTSGGGMLVGHDKEKVEEARFLATQARDPAPYYVHTHIGYNYRMSNIVAAIGRGQLKVLDERVKRRREIFEVYNKGLGDIQGITFMPEPRYGQSNRWLTCILIDPEMTGVTYEDVRLVLEKENIESRPLWKPMHLQLVFDQYSFYTNGISENFFKNGLCLPSGTSLTDNELKQIIELIRNTVL